ncbi:cobalamin biosynthesis protein CobD [Rhodobacter sp. NTK016B]|uniref:adenosylcobinamide-phosphate synthase CbiB n=1 Tax=Rhodobacter sp. NTK016B TaxID=2759676 RepID=UPI001A8D5B88|nr:adenosylcobinamide-phosphate synthase CbiB [Rhodobacter sp. NTK016B]MBN8293474.1 cobalamin biosynthesis protein CobD [Rhodobacter sp. NTK016B]
MSAAAAILIAMLIDAALGWPDALYRRIGHPVTWIGALIHALEANLNRGPFRRAKGVAAALIAIAVPTGVALAIVLALPDGWIGTVFAGILAWPLVALRSMHQHVAAVAAPLARGDLSAARFAVSMIVGRDPNRLDKAGVARAAVESLAENTSDGIVAPVFWGVVAGLPGIVAYKAINTLDSMIGHRTERYEQFGWASARIDDLVNLIPARLTGGLFALVSGHAQRALRVVVADARHHRSPNAGWPEAAMAGALWIRLSGPRVYERGVSDEPWVNATAPDPGPADLSRALRLYRHAMTALAAMVAILAVTGW